MHHVLYLMNKFITLLIFIIIPGKLAVSSGFDWLLGRDTAVAATPGVGSGGVSTSVSNDRTIN